MKKILVSACLLGHKCRYDGNSNLVSKIVQLNDKYILIPICPEVMGNLSIPRNKSERKGNIVIDEYGNNVTSFFFMGANKSLDIAIKEKVDFCILKENSPSCGVHFIHDGNFKGNKIKGKGITCELLEKNNFKCYSENEEIIDQLNKD